MQPYRIDLRINTNSGTINIGNTIITSSATSSKMYSGAGSGAVGDGSSMRSLLSVTITYDPIAADDSAITRKKKKKLQ